MRPARIRLLPGIALALLVAATALSFAGVAHAQSAVSGTGWSGWYVGGHYGRGSTASPVNIIPMSDGAIVRNGFVSPVLDTSPKGIVGGLQFGLNRQAGNIVYGFEADLSRASITDTVVGPYLLPNFNFQTTDAQRLNWLGTVRARVGFTPFDRSLIFVTGGLAYGYASLSMFAIGTTDNICNSTIKFCITNASEKWLIGWTLGGGWEQALVANWSVKVEYLRYDLGRITNTMTDILVPNPDVFLGSTRISGNIVRAGVNYRFGER